MLVSERPLPQAVKSSERADPIALPFISPESRFDPGNLICLLKKRFLKRAAIGYVIWDHLLACKAELIQKQALFLFPCRTLRAE